jgi:hypothetical protein
MRIRAYGKSRDGSGPGAELESAPALMGYGDDRRKWECRYSRALHGATGHNGHWVIPGRNRGTFTRPSANPGDWHLNISLGGAILRDMLVSRLNSVAISLLPWTIYYLSEDTWGIPRT